MKGSSKGRAAGLETRQEWTARLNRFAEAKTPEEKQAVFEHAQQINPGGTIRSMLEAWGYSASGRGRKAKGASAADRDAKPARERLEDALADLYGSESNPVKSLYPKLAGKTFATVRDTERIVAALLWAWPEPLKRDGKGSDERRRRARPLAVEFVRALLAELSESRSWEWKSPDIDLYAFRLADEERIGLTQFIREAGEKEGALIVAGARNILIGTHPVNTVRQFSSITTKFIGGEKGILIFVFELATIEGGERQFNSIYNLGLLSTAITSFALIENNYDVTGIIETPKVDWARWRALSRRCCAVIRKLRLVDPKSGDLLEGARFDEFIASWEPNNEFARLEEFNGVFGFDSKHVLPSEYPVSWREHEILPGHDLYWDVVVRNKPDDSDNMGVQYFIPPPEVTRQAFEALEKPDKRVGRPTVKTSHIEDDLHYVVRKPSPGISYDGAQRAIYMAARGRLHLDIGAHHTENLRAAAVLRQIGFEVLPISIMLSLFPRLLDFATAYGPGCVKTLADDSFAA